MVKLAAISLKECLIFLVGFSTWTVLFVTIGHEPVIVFKENIGREKQLFAYSQVEVSEDKQHQAVITDDLVADLSQLQRDLYNQLLESWFYIRANVGNFSGNEPLNKNLYDRYRNLFAKTERYRDLLEPARKNMSQNLAKIVFQRILHLQNPTDCKASKFAVCEIQVPACGFGCQIHHVAYCLMISYALNRTVYLNGTSWVYANEGFTSLFHPLGDAENKCASIINEHQSLTWLNSAVNQEDIQVLYIPTIHYIAPDNIWPDYAPMAVPRDLAGKITAFHGQPFAWWVGQFARFILRPLPSMCKNLSEAFKRRFNVKLANFNEIKPLVGIHVRRTDKLWYEAKYYPLSEYARWANEYFDQLEYKLGRNVTRSVYIATDEISVLHEAKNEFPNYKIYMDPKITKSASLEARYSGNSSLDGILIDLIWLARSDFLVCTFSSNLCRLAYELMQTLHGDASDRFRSLDDIYFFWGQRAHYFEVVIPHAARNRSGEIDLEIGDRVHVEDVADGDDDSPSPLQGNYWNGYSIGVNNRTKRIGFFPTYKVRDIIATAHMPNYTEVVYKKQEFNLPYDSCLLI